MKVHELKTWPIYYAAIADGTKRFELRKDDRDFLCGDQLHLREYDPDTATYTGREMNVYVTYTLRGFPGLNPKYVLMSILAFED